MGWTFNTVDPNAPTDGPKISAVAIIMTTLAMVTVILRVYVRQFMVKAFGAGTFRLVTNLILSLYMLIAMFADDWVIVYAWVSPACGSTAARMGCSHASDFICGFRYPVLHP